MDTSSNHVRDIAYLYENIVNDQLNEEDIGKSSWDAITGKGKKPVPNPSDKGGVTVDAGPVKIGVTNPKTDIGKQSGEAIVKTAQDIGGAVAGAVQSGIAGLTGLTKGKGSAPAAAKSKPTAPAKPQTVAAAGGKGGKVTVGKEYDATLGGKAGKVTYDAKGQKSFKPSVSDAPAAAKPSPTPSAPSDSWKPKTKGEAEWAKNFPHLAARLNPDGTQKGTGQSKVEKDLAALRSDKQKAEIQKANDIIKSGKVAALNPKTDTVQSTQAAQKKPAPTPSVKPAPTPSNDDLSDADKKRIDDFKKLNAFQKLGQRSSVEAELAKMSPSRRQKVMDYYNQKESYDAYEVVLEYLFDNGHVDTLDEAHYVMMEMDSKTIQSIVETSGEWFRGIFNPKNSVASKAQNTSPFATQPKPLPSIPSPFAKPASRGDSGRLTTYGAGGGAAAERRGQTRDQVMQQGAKNLENKKQVNQKPVNQGPDFGR